MPKREGYVKALSGNCWRGPYVFHHCCPFCCGFRVGGWRKAGGKGSAMWRARKVLFLLSVGILVLCGAPLDAKEARRPTDGPLITIQAPRAQQFEVALDEVGLDWSRVPGAKAGGLAGQANPAGSARIVESGDVHARAAFPPVGGLSELQGMAEALRAANPGADVYLVLYEPGQRKSERTRQFLTREVGLLMEKGVDPREALKSQLPGEIRPVPGVPDGYVVEAANPLAALDLAGNLMQQPGVRSAYPLVKRYHVKR